MSTTNLFRGRAANGQAGVGAGYDCEIRRESADSVVVNVTAVGSDGDYLERIDVPMGADLAALARRIAASPFEYVEANLPDAEWDALAEAWNKLGDEPWVPSALRLSARAALRLAEWMAEVAKPGVRVEAVEAELLDVARDRLAAGESLTYELAPQHTTSGRPAFYFIDREDLEVAQ